MLLSIVIPTHNRAKYAYPTIVSLLRLGVDVQIVVCDSSDDNQLHCMLAEQLLLPNFIYVKTPSSFSVVDNFNEGVDHVNGDYVAFIGDDDIVGCDVTKVANWAKEEAIDAVKFSFPAQYHWPDFASSVSGTSLASKLVVKSFSGKVTCIDAKKMLQNAVSDFGRGVVDMPRAYSGLVSLALLKRIKGQYKTVFGGVSPDIYSSVLISYMAEKVFLVDLPIIVPGVSGGSTSGQSVNGGHLGKLRDNSHIGQFANLVWDNRIPEFYSVPTVWGYSMLKALEKIGYPEDKIPFAALYFKCYLKHPEYKEYVSPVVSKYIEKNGRSIFYSGLLFATLKETRWFLTKSILYIWRRILGFAKSSRSDKSFENLASTIEASDVIDEINEGNELFK